MLAALLRLWFGRWMVRPRSLVAVDALVVGFLALVAIAGPLLRSALTGPLLDVPLAQSTLTIRSPVYDRTLTVSFETPVRVSTVRPNPAPNEVGVHHVNQTIELLTIPSFGMSETHNIDIAIDGASSVAIRELRRDGEAMALSSPPILNRGAVLRARPSVTAGVARVLTWALLLLGDLAIVGLVGVLFMVAIRSVSSALAACRLRRRVLEGDLAKERRRVAERTIEYASVLSVMAPTVGFFLTALALVSALAGTLDSASVDLGFFYSSVSLAMVSTALGLIVRLAAQALILLESFIAERLDAAQPTEVVAP